jgi:peptidoglycan/xylan/chitin deacetylase (PgdA/CDA1 family)
MRPDRLITLNVVQPCRWVAHGFKSLVIRNPSPDRCLPILMYHSIAEKNEGGMPAYYQTTTHPKVFARQMALLKAEGFQGVDLSTGLAWLKSANPDSHVRPVAITFDDGFRNFFTEAFPVLQQQGFTATMFLATAFISQPRRRFKDTECLAWDEVCELRKGGMRFGSHTVNHPRLTDLSWPEIEHELRTSKSELEQHLGEPATTFAYPFAFPQSDRSFRQSFKNLLIEAGYDCCVTTEIGRVKLGDDLHHLKRLPVNSLDDAALFQAKLAGAYDWLANGQATFKTLKRMKGRHSPTAN